MRIISVAGSTWIERTVIINAYTAETRKKEGGRGRQKRDARETKEDALRKSRSVRSIRPSLVVYKT